MRGVWVQRVGDKGAGVQLAHKDSPPNQPCTAAPMRRVLRLLGVCLSVWVPLTGASLAWAQSPAANEEQIAQNARLEMLREEIAGQVQLASFELLDEMVYGWRKDPVFDKTESVVLAGVTAPVGLGAGLQALLENHVTELVLANPGTRLRLVHCPACSGVVVHSSSQGTVVSRGVDNPAVMERLMNSGARHALFLDVEAEGHFLVLRARLTKLTPELPIVWARTLSSEGRAAALLREPERIKSAAEARQEYLAALRDRGPISVPLRFAVRTFARPDAGIVAPPPLVWVQAGVEVGITEARSWTANFLLGFTRVPSSYNGLMLQARLHGLLSGDARALTRPNLYGFVGTAIMSITGPAALAFRDTTLTTEDVIADADSNEEARVTMGTLHAGLELRLSHRIGIAVFLETLPALQNSANTNAFVEFIGIDFQAIGMEASFWF